jgi:DNA-binding MarR family transcriptional regulator
VLPKKKTATRLENRDGFETGIQASKRPYVMEEQVGYLLRLANQRHTSLFMSKMVSGLTTTQFAALTKLHDVGRCSQNQLGRLTSIDNPTIKGVVGRLTAKGLLDIVVDPRDSRRRSISLSRKGRAVVKQGLPIAAAISEATISPISPREREVFLRLLRLIGKTASG